ncbi:hypothetical protein ACTLTU_003034 [Klebsiella oxytoca]
MTTDITELAQDWKAAAHKAKRANDLYLEGKITLSECVVETKDYLDYSDNPNNLLALVEALERKEEQRANWFQMAQKLGEDLDAAEKRIAELESRTVRLPDDEDGQACGFGKWSNSKLPATAGTMTIAYCEDAWRAAFEVFSSAAGIKVEAE